MKYFEKILILLIILIIILLNSCKQNRTNYDIYISGNYYNDKDISIACYWFNNIKIDLNVSSYDSEAKTILIKENDIYCAGFYKNQEGIKIACYWKNGIKIDIGDGKNNSYINSMTISNDDLFFAGNINEGFKKDYACYWKNNQLIKISNNYDYAESEKIKIYNNKIYIIAHTNNYPFIWIDGLKEYLVCNYTGLVNDLIIENNDFYICGRADYFKACYWINGKLNLLKEADSNCYSVKWNNKKLFLAGIYHKNQNNPKACYWINNKIYKLENEKDEISFKKVWSEAKNIFILDKNIIIIGTHQIEDEKINNICYWLNGKIFYISDGKFSCKYGDSLIFRKEISNEN